LTLVRILTYRTNSVADSKRLTLKKLLIVLATLATVETHSQSVKVLYKSDIKNLSEGKKFAYIEPATDTNFLQYVATIQAKDKNKKSVLENLFAEIRKEANKLGATCYKINFFTRGSSTNEAILTLDCYFAYDATLATNTANHEINVVYIFGKEKEDDGRTISVDVNDSVQEIKAGTFLKYTLKEGEELKISKGGFTGATVWLKWEADKQPQFYTLTGFGLSDIQQQPYYPGQSSIGFNTGRINKITDISLGLLLVNLLKQCN